MAGVELANAWVNIIPNTSKIAPQIKSAFGEVDRISADAGKRMGAAIDGGFGSKVKSTVGRLGGLAVGLAGVSSAAQVMQNGFAKVTSIEDTTQALGVMMGSADKAAGFMDKLVESNMKSTYSFDAWAEAGKTLVAFGVDAEQANKTVTALGEAAAATGKGEEALLSMSDAFGQAAASGNISMDTINRLSAGGVQGLTILANHFGVTTEEMQKMISSGAVPAEEGIKALTDGIINGSEGAAGKVEKLSGVMGKMAETTSGTLKNMGAELTNTAAAIFEKISPGIKLVADKIRVGAQDVTKWIQGIDLSQLGEQMAPTLQTLGDAFKDLGPAVGSLAGTFGEVVSNISVSTWTALAGALNALAPLITTVLVPLVEQVADFASQNPGAIQAIVTAFLGFKAVSSIAGPVGTAVATIKNLGGAAKFAHTAFKGASLGEGMLNIMAGAKSANPVVAKMGTSMAGAGTKMAKGSMAASGVGKAFSMIGRAAMTVIRFINPWVAGFTLVTSALTLFFTKTETGRKVWDSFAQALGAGWDWVVEKFQAGLDWVQSTFGPVFSQIGETISGAWDATVEKVTGAIDRVKEIFSGALDFLKTGDTTDYAAALGISEDSPIFTALTFFRDRIVDLKNVAVAAWDFMKSKWSEFTTGFGQFYQTWIAPVIDFIGTAFGALKDVAVAAWGLMKAKWEEFTIGFGQFYQTWIAPGVNLLVTIFGVLRDAAVAGWQLMQQKWQEFTQLFVEFYQVWIVPIIDAMQIGFQILGSVVSAAFNGIWTAIQFVGSVISAVWSGIIQPILSLFMSVVSSVASFVVPIFTAVIGGAFRTMGSLISNVWNGVIKPAWDFFRNAAGLLADVLTGNFSNIRNRFSSMGQAISNVVHGVINSAMNFFKSIFENAKQVAASFGQAIGRMVGTVRNKIGEMMGVLGQIPGKVQGVFASAGSWLVNAGKNIISGLINGIKSMFGQVENAIGSVMPDKIRGMIGFSGGGIYMAQGGITRAYIDGGIDKLERYANGGSKEKHTAQIAKGGEWRIWAEPETGGESYIPLAKSKRKRSTQILAKTADIFGLSVVDKKGEPVKPGTSSQVAPAKTQYFANGGIMAKELRAFAEGARVKGYQASRSLEGAPYVFGGSNWGDCSGTASAFAALASGMNPFPRKFATMDEAAWLSSHGFHRGRGKKGDLRIGFKNGGPGGGHTASTLPDGTNVEMGGGRGNGQIGGRAAGAWDSYFNEFFYKTIKPPKPPKMNKILDQNAIPDGSTMTIDGVPVTVSADDTTTTGSTGENTVTVALSPEDAAKATAAEGLGDQSILDFAVDGIFDMLGMKDSTIKKLLTTKGKDLFPSGDSIVTTKEVKEQPRTNVAAKNAQAIESDAVASMPETQMAKDPQLAAPKPKKKEGPKWGEPFFAREIARSAKAHNLDVDGAKIGIATALVESGNPMKMWANRAVPESLKFRHDAVGSDYDSVGLFQQRDNGAWGTVKQRMTPYDSAGMFFDAMLRKYPNWKGMDPGAVAQGVQVSAFPDRYAGQMGRGLQLAKRSGVFDRGGLGYGKGLLPKDVVAPERVLSPQQTRSFDDLVYKELPRQRKDGDATTVVINLDGQEVLRQRVDKVEGELSINTNEIGRLRRRTSVAVAGTTRGGAM